MRQSGKHWQLQEKERPQRLKLKPLLPQNLKQQQLMPSNPQLNQWLWTRQQTR